MFIFYLTLLATFILSVMARLTKGKSNQPNILITIVIMGVLILVSGLRNNIGDTAAYQHLYTLVGNGLVAKGSYETGFMLFLSLLNQISGNPQLMIFVTALITNGLFIGMFRKYSSLFELQTYLYITSGYYLVTMNGVRQALVAAILFASTKFITENKFIIYLLITLIMTTFHTSALIMIPVYFIARQEVWSKKTMILIFALPIVFIFFQPLMSIMFKTIEGTRYASYEGAIMTGGEGGANVVRVIIAAIPVVIAYFGRHKLKQDWVQSNLFVNMSLINLIIMLFSLFNWLFARFTLYFQPYNFILLPYMINTLCNREEKPLIYYLLVLFYFAYFYYEQAITLHINYLSDFF
ncbi:MAG: EpsG family protein [Carboxydocellales bacterium]